MTDKERERVIESYRLQLIEAADPHAKRVAALRMKELIAGRSPQQVTRMERAKGLR